MDFDKIREIKIQDRLDALKEIKDAIENIDDIVLVNKSGRTISLKDDFFEDLVPRFEGSILAGVDSLEDRYREKFKEALK